MRPSLAAFTLILTIQLFITSDRSGSETAQVLAALGAGSAALVTVLLILAQARADQRKHTRREIR